MLPNLKFLICGILFCFLLFAVTGAGVMLPDSRTHVGEMPEIGRPMMQRSMAEAPAQAQVYMAAVTRRSGELERLRGRAPAESAAAPAQPEPNLSKPDLPKPDIVANEAAEDLPVAHPTPEGTPGQEAVTSIQAPPAETRSGGQTDEAGPSQVAVLSVPAAEDTASLPRFVNVPLPPTRPAVFNDLRRHWRVLHRRNRILQQHDTARLGAAGQGVPASQGVTAGYSPSEAASR
jgi:hypothetical protein